MTSQDASGTRQHLVDQLIDRGIAMSIATDWSLTLPKDWVEDLALDGNRLDRPSDVQRAGYFRAPVYRGFELVAQPLTLPVLILTDASGIQPSLYMNTATGVIGPDLVTIGLSSAAPPP